MFKKAIYTAVILLAGLFFMNPSFTYAVEGVEQTDEDLMYITGEPETTTEDTPTTYYEDYDWESAWNELEEAQGTTNYEDLTEEEAAALGMFGVIFGGAMLFVSVILGLISYVYFSLTLMVTAKKLNVNNTWLAWVPIANLFLANKAAGLNAWMTLLWIIPFANIVYGTYVYMMLSEKRGFNKWLGLLMWVPVANIVFPGYLAWGEPKKVA